jgi:hypothetical protein
LHIGRDPPSFPLHLCPNPLRRSSHWTVPLSIVVLDQLSCSFWHSCNAVYDYTVDYFFKNTGSIYFTLLQLIISLINIYHFLNHGRLFSGCKCPLLRRNTVLLVSWRRSVTPHSCRVHNHWIVHTLVKHLSINYHLSTDFISPWTLYRSFLEHWAVWLRQLVFIAPVIVRHSAPAFQIMPQSPTRCLQNSLHSSTASRCLTTLWRGTCSRDSDIASNFRTMGDVRHS